MSEKILEFKVLGMTCQGCADTVTSAIQSVKGVREVRVELDQKRARVVFDPHLADEEDIKRAVVKSGFTVG